MQIKIFKNFEDYRNFQEFSWNFGANIIASI